MLILTLCFFSSQGSLSSLLQEIYENFAHQQTCENFVFKWDCGRWDGLALVKQNIGHSILRDIMI